MLICPIEHHVAYLHCKLSIKLVSFELAELWNKVVVRCNTNLGTITDLFNIMPLTGYVVIGI